MKSLSACVRVIQTSSLDVDFEDYDVFFGQEMNCVYNKCFGNT